MSPFILPMMIPNMAAGQVAIDLGARGPHLLPGDGLRGLGQSIAEALELVRRGRADAVIAGGAEAAITPIGIAGSPR